MCVFWCDSLEDDTIVCLAFKKKKKKKVPIVVTWYVAVHGEKLASWHNAVDNRGFVLCEMDEWKV